MLAVTRNPFPLVVDVVSLLHQTPRKAKGFRVFFSISLPAPQRVRLFKDYLLGAGKTYHPLEAVLHAATGSGDWQTDAATVLGVDQEWIDGFTDGFCQEPETSTGGEYVQGYLSAEELRMTRYRKELPDR
jgi:hypothetical protein